MVTEVALPALPIVTRPQHEQIVTVGRMVLAKAPHAGHLPFVLAFGFGGVGGAIVLLV